MLSTLLPLMLLAPAQAPAWDSVGATWPVEAVPVEVKLAAELPEGVDVAEVEAELEAALQTWSEVDCTPLSLTYGGRVEGAAFSEETDGDNVVFLLDSGWPEDAGLLSTPVIRTSGSQLVEVDLALNFQYFSWTTDAEDTSGAYDLQGAFAHELGHLVGLWHSTEAGATLNPAMDGDPEARTLEEDDLTGLCELYGDLVLDSEEPGEFGEACTNNDDCAEGLVCAADGEVRTCTQTCETDAECFNGYACYESADGVGVCATVLDEGGCGGCATGPRSAEGEPRQPAPVILALGLLLAARRRS